MRVNISPEFPRQLLKNNASEMLKFVAPFVCCGLMVFLAQVHEGHAQSEPAVGTGSTAAPNAPAVTSSPSPTPVAPKPPVPPKPTNTPKPPLKPSPSPAFVPEPSKKFPKVVTKLIIEELQKGRGRTAKPMSQLVVHYSSWIYDSTQPLGRGPQFETTQGKSPYSFKLQNPETPHIKGWEQGFVDMRVGGRRRLIIPPDLAYGANGAGQTIPPSATLLYEVELVDVE